LHVAVVGAPTVKLFILVPEVPVTVKVEAPLLIDGAVIAPLVKVPVVWRPEFEIVVAPPIAPFVKVTAPNVCALVLVALMVPVVYTALPVPLPAPTVNVFKFVPVVLVTVNVLAPLLMDGAVIAPLFRVPVV
jgi:hypothetical protein